MKKNTAPLVGIIMGRDSDWPTMRAAVEACGEFGVPCEARVVSAHRTPEDMVRYAKAAHRRGLKVVIAGAGGAAHLPGMVASLTPLPVIGGARNAGLLAVEILATSDAALQAAVIRFRRQQAAKARRSNRTLGQ